MGEGGVPLLSVKFFFVKNRPKNSVFWAKNAVFGGKFVEFRPLWGGGIPPHSVNFFPLVFRKNSVRYGGRHSDGILELFKIKSCQKIKRNASICIKIVLFTKIISFFGYVQNNFFPK